MKIGYLRRGDSDLHRVRGVVAFVAFRDQVDVVGNGSKPIGPGGKRVN